LHSADDAIQYQTILQFVQDGLQGFAPRIPFGQVSSLEPKARSGDDRNGGLLRVAVPQLVEKNGMNCNSPP